jgi:hypothetical protein
MGRPSRWTAGEDATLTRLVIEYGKLWALIARDMEVVGGEKITDHQCLTRWKSIDPALSKGKWSAEEDASLLELVKKLGASSWSAVSEKLASGRRSNEQCRMRWRSIDPALTKGEWAVEEDAELKRLVAEHGTAAWVKISKSLEGKKRSDINCFTRWKTLDPSKGLWTAEEDNQLTMLVNEYGTTSWTLVANGLTVKRSAAKCRDHWKKNLSQLVRGSDPSNVQVMDPLSAPLPRVDMGPVNSVGSNTDAVGSLFNQAMVEVPAHREDPPDLPPGAIPLQMRMNIEMIPPPPKRSKTSAVNLTV